MPRFVIVLGTSTKIKESELKKLLAGYFPEQDFKILRSSELDVPSTQEDPNLIAQKAQRKYKDVVLSVGVCGQMMPLPDSRGEGLVFAHAEFGVFLTRDEYGGIIPVMLWPDINYRLRDQLKEVEKEVGVAEGTFTNRISDHEQSALEALVDAVRFELGEYPQTDESGNPLLH